ncbi:hypothetical protein Dimus_021343 [Dionaea muscipula]
MLRVREDGTCNLELTSIFLLISCCCILLCSTAAASSTSSCKTSSISSVDRVGKMKVRRMVIETAIADKNEVDATSGLVAETRIARSGGKGRGIGLGGGDSRASKIPASLAHNHPAGGLQANLHPHQRQQRGNSGCCLSSSILLLLSMTLAILATLVV